MNDLKLSSRVIYSFLYYLSAIKNPVAVRNEFIADKLGVSIDTVKRGLTELKKVKLIKITNSNRHRHIEVKQLDLNNYINELAKDMIKDTENYLSPEITFFRLEIDEETNDLLDRVFDRL